MDDRYRTPEMDAIWGQKARNQRERQLWIEVMRAQKEAGVPIPDEAIAGYESAADTIPRIGGDIELQEIAKIEAQTRHDLYARLQYFNECAEYGWAHHGLTSADIVENVQQLQILDSMQILAQHGEQLIARLYQMIHRGATLPLVARTHGRPAQLTTLGKRCVDWATEISEALTILVGMGEWYPARGIKGAVGTRIDLAAMLMRHRAPDSDVSALEMAEQVEYEVMVRSGLDEQVGACGQNYPRGLDLPLVAAALQLAAACDTVATNIRLWAVLGHANEQHTSGQVGSSAMPHKINPRYSERVHSLCMVARGYATMLQQAAGGQWFEGDVSTSAVRRVALPGLFHTVDAILANTAYALDRLEFHGEAIDLDVSQNLPLLASGLILDTCVAAGMQRSAAHAHITAVTRAASLAGSKPAEWLEALAAHPDLPLTQDQLAQLVDIERLIQPAVWVVEQARELAQGLVPELNPSWPGELL